MMFGMFQIRARDRSGTDAKRLVGVAHVQRRPVGFGKDGNGRDAELVAGAIDA